MRNVLEKECYEFLPLLVVPKKQGLAVTQLQNCFVFNVFYYLVNLGLTGTNCLLRLLLHELY